MKRITGLLTIAAGATQAAGLATEALAADPACGGAEAAWHAGIEKMPPGAGLMTRSRPREAPALDTADLAAADTDAGLPQRATVDPNGGR